MQRKDAPRFVQDDGVAAALDAARAEPRLVHAVRRSARVQRGVHVRERRAHGIGAAHRERRCRTRYRERGAREVRQHGRRRTRRSGALRSRDRGPCCEMRVGDVDADRERGWLDRVPQPRLDAERRAVRQREERVLLVHETRVVHVDAQSRACLGHMEAESAARRDGRRIVKAVAGGRVRRLRREVAEQDRGMHVDAIRCKSHSAWERYVGILRLDRDEVREERQRDERAARDAADGRRGRSGIARLVRDAQATHMQHKTRHARLASHVRRRHADDVTPYEVLHATHQARGAHRSAAAAHPAHDKRQHDALKHHHTQRQREHEQEPAAALAPRRLGLHRGGGRWRRRRYRPPSGGYRRSYSASKLIACTARRRSRSSSCFSCRSSI